MNGVTRAGYTFQTVLGSMGLNHMNGRIEDSVTGRFLSPDPRGTMPGNTQSWNRYSYVLNNPLTLTDPTGFTSEQPPPTDGGINVGGSFTTYTGSNIPGINMGIGTCTGSCDGFNQASFGSSSASGGAAGATSPGANYQGSLGGGIEAAAAALAAGIDPNMFNGALAQSQDGLDPITVTAQSLSSGQGGACGPCCGGSCGATAQPDPCATGGCLPEITVTASRLGLDNGSDVASSLFAGAGTGAAGLELGYGEHFLGIPNGGLYTRAWANGVGRTVGVGTLTKSFGFAGFLASTAFDYDSLSTGNITQAQFDINAALGLASLSNAANAVLLAPYIFINSSYDGGLPQYLLDHPEATLPLQAYPYIDLQ